MQSKAYKERLVQENISQEKFWHFVAEQNYVVDWGFDAALRWAQNKASFESASKKPRRTS